MSAMDPTSPGGRALHRLRRQRGHTQASLGAASGVSVRTIRGIERGEILTPQVATLQQVAIAMRLSPREQVAFLRTWATERRPTMDEVLEEPDLTELEQIDALNRRTLGSYRSIFSSSHTVVGTQRRIERTRYEYAIQAEDDDLDTLVSIQTGDQSTPAHRMHLNGLRGCTAGGRRDFPDSDVAVYEISLSRSLGRGERHGHAYEIVHDLLGATALEPSDGFTKGTLTTARCLSVSVEFAVEPTMVQHLRKRPGHEHEFLEEIALDDGHAVIVLEDEPPSGHGFYWTW